MSIVFSCECGKMFSVKDELAGQRGKCTACGSVITVPLVSSKTQSDETSSIEEAGVENSRRRLLAVAKAQRMVLWTILAYLVLNIVCFPMLTRDIGLQQTLMECSVIVVYALVTCAVVRVAIAAKQVLVWVTAIVTLLSLFVPFLGLVLLAALSSEATLILKSGGIPVGLMGVRTRDLDKLSHSACDKGESRQTP